MASDSHNYPYPSPTAAQQLEQQLAGGAIAAAAAAAAAAADLERDLQNQAEHDGVDSPSHQPVVDNVNATSPKRTVPAKRKQSDRHSNRGVANLTPEQLVKKRRNDREAQRAIRERTKTKIETLEARITELEGQQPYRELQIAIRARDAVIAENEELKQKLTTFIGSVTNYTNPPSAAAAAAAAAHGLDHLALATSRQEPLPVSEAQAYDDALVVHENEDNESRHLDPHLRHDAGQPHATDDANDHALTPLTDQHDAFPIHFQYQNDDEMDQVFRSTIPEDNLRHSLTTNLVDDTTTIFQHPAVSALDSHVAADFDLISWNVKRLLDSVSHNEGDPLRLLERNAYFCSFFFLLRWLRQPDKYTLDSVPEFLGPTSLQQTKPHSACLDLVPWPGMRDALIELDIDTRQAQTILHEIMTATIIQIPDGQSASLHEIEYPFRPDNSEPDLPQRTIQTTTPEFEAHVRDINHWSLSQDFARRMPELMEAGQVKAAPGP